MKVESRVRVIDEAATAGLVAAVSTRSAPTLSVQGLGVAPGIDRQKVFEHAGGDPVRQAGGKLRPDLIEFGRRAAMCWPAVAPLHPPPAGQPEGGGPGTN